MNPVLPSTDAERERFWALVDRREPDECWPWVGALGSYGHGRFALGGKNVIASRVSWAIANGQEPGLCVCHSCDNPPCCNPAHLWIGTMGDNTRDMAAKGRHGNKPRVHCRHGHSFTPDNIYHHVRGYRECLTCRRARIARNNEAARARSAAL